MKIRYLGHSTFEIKSAKTIVTDPHDPEHGALPPDLAAEIVTVSHSHHDHNYLEGVGGSPQVIDKVGEHDLGDIKIEGIATFHDEVAGAKRGNNIVFTYELENLRLAHLGDLGHRLSKEQIAQIGHVDVLMIPVGGTYTIDPAEAKEVTNQLKPRLVVPMHYKQEPSSPLADVATFESKLGWMTEPLDVLEIDQKTIAEHEGRIIQLMPSA